MFILDAHLDLSMNALEWNRDLTQSLSAINKRESGLTDKPDRTNALVSLPELRKGTIGMVVATLIGRYVSAENKLPGWHSPAQAWAQTQGQLAWYRAMEEAGEMIQIQNLAQLETHLLCWSGRGSDLKKPIGYMLSLEGADSIRSPHNLEHAYTQGLRALGPAHYGPGRYAQGTDASGPMTAAGYELLKEMERLNIILDATHLCDQSFWDALDHFNGPVWASHNNCRALVNHNRQYSDQQLKALIDRGAVIGGALDAWMLVPGWIRGQSDPRAMHCSLNVLINHLDHINQLAGNSLHTGIGSDLDGAFGREQCPFDLETIADLQKIGPLLAARGYSATDIENMTSGNWLRFLRKAWKE